MTDSPTPRAGVEALKPCPFCGGEAEIDSGSGVWGIECSNPTCFVLPSVAMGSESEARRVWNQRAALPPESGRGGWRPITEGDKNETELLVAHHGEKVWASWSFGATCWVFNDDGRELEPPPTICFDVPDPLAPGAPQEPTPDDDGPCSRCNGAGTVAKHWPVHNEPDEIVCPECHGTGESKKCATCGCTELDHRGLLTCRCPAGAAPAPSARGEGEMARVFQLMANMERRYPCETAPCKHEKLCGMVGRCYGKEHDANVKKLLNDILGNPEEASRG